MSTLWQRGADGELRKEEKPGKQLALVFKEPDPIELRTANPSMSKSAHGR